MTKVKAIMAARTDTVIHPKDTPQIVAAGDINGVENDTLFFSLFLYALLTSVTRFSLISTLSLPTSSLTPQPSFFVFETEQEGLSRGRHRLAPPSTTVSPSYSKHASAPHSFFTYFSLQISISLSKTYTRILNIFHSPVLREAPFEMTLSFSSLLEYSRPNTLKLRKYL